MAAHVGKTSFRLGGVDREFGLLTAEDLVELSAKCPNPSGELINIADLNRYTMHATGCGEILFAAARKINPLLTLKAVSEWGSILTRTKAAKHVFDLSVLSGEETLIPKATGGDEGTGTSTPASSPNDAPATGTPGN